MKPTHLLHYYGIFTFKSIQSKDKLKEGKFPSPHNFMPFKFLLIVFMSN